MDRLLELPHDLLELLLLTKMTIEGVLNVFYTDQLAAFCRRKDILGKRLAHGDELFTHCCKTNNANAAFELRRLGYIDYYEKSPYARICRYDSDKIIELLAVNVKWARCKQDRTWDYFLARHGAVRCARALLKLGREIGHQRMLLNTASDFHKTDFEKFIITTFRVPTTRVFFSYADKLDAETCIFIHQKSRVAPEIDKKKLISMTICKDGYDFLQDLVRAKVLARECVADVINNLQKITE